MEEAIQYKGYNINISIDEWPADPREWDNIGTMLCWHPDYELGDIRLKNEESLFQQMADESCCFDNDGFYSEDYGKIMKCMKDKCIILPLYLYDHSGITMKTNPFNCRWDSGAVGFIFVRKSSIKKEYGWKRLNVKRIRKIKDILISEVSTYDNYISGSVYGYTIEDGTTGELIGSCCGFYGYDHEKSGLMEYAKDDIDCWIEQKRKEKQNQLFKYIRASVPLEYRWI